MLLIISIIVFGLSVIIPGDPARTIAGLNAPQSEVEQDQRATRPEQAPGRPVLELADSRLARQSRKFDSAEQPCGE